MGKPNHNSLKWNKQAAPNKIYKDLKQKQKARISEWMFTSVCDFYKDHDRMPQGGELEPLAKQVYAKIQGAAIWVPYASFYSKFEKKLPHFHEHISNHGLPEPKPPKVKKTAKEKQAYKRARRSKSKKGTEAFNPLPEQDDNFFFIAGYTSGGEPYGVTWEEMGLEPWQSLED